MSYAQGNTSGEESPKPTPLLKTILWPSVFSASLFFPLFYWALQGVGSALMGLVMLARLVWTGVGIKGVSFVLCALALGALCMLVRGAPRVKAYGMLIFMGLSVFMAFSVFSVRPTPIYELVEGKGELNALSLSRVHQELAKNSLGSNQGRQGYGTQNHDIQRLALGNYARDFSKLDCEKLQQQAWDSQAFAERYVLFVENQVSTRQTPVKCSVFSSNRIVVAYNATYAPNGLVATLEASKAK